MKYTLMHRKIPAAEIEISEKNAALIKVNRLYEPDHIPVGVTIKNCVPDSDDLNDWWFGRSIPASRQNFREAMKTLGVSSSEKLILRCFGLSLSDQFWINPVGNPLEWESVNFFDNPFSDDVGNILFGEKTEGKIIDSMSPDNTSDGWLKKKWGIINGKRCLIKGGSEPFFQEPFNEAMASLLMSRLNVNHVNYGVIWQNKLPYSVCEGFISSETDLVSAYNISNTQKISGKYDVYRHFVKCCSDLGIKNVRRSLDMMIVIDYLIANRDRHLNNFGAVRNAESLKWLGIAPVYDSGTSFWNNFTDDMITGSNKIKCQPFCDSHDEQIKLVSDFSWIDFDALDNIDNELYKILKSSQPHLPRRLSDARIENICAAFNGRVKSLKQLIL